MENVDVVIIALLGLRVACHLASPLTFPDLFL